jgi:hypothetical protein
MLCPHPGQKLAPQVGYPHSGQNWARSVPVSFRWKVAIASSPVSLTDAKPSLRCQAASPLPTDTTKGAHQNSDRILLVAPTPNTRSPDSESRPFVNFR